MMMGNKKRLAIMIAGGDGSEDKGKYSDMAGEGLEIAMKKVISAIKDGDAQSASKNLKTWFDICQGDDDDEGFSSSKNGNTTSFDDEEY